MNSVNFYHLKKTNTYVALRKLVEKAMQQEKRVLLRTGSNIISEEISEMLWSYDLSSFIPHSKLGDPDSEFSSIHITHDYKNPNGASFFFIINTSNFSLREIDEFERSFILFNNEDTEFKLLAQKLWSDLKTFDFELRYWIEESTGWKLKKSF